MEIWLLCRDIIILDLDCYIDMKGKLLTLVAVVSVAMVLQCGGCSSKSEKSVKEVQASEKSYDQADTDHSAKLQNASLAHVLPQNGNPTLLDFSATWCGPCQMMAPVFVELEDTYGDMINFVTVDVDENPELTGEFNIEAVPTFIFLDENGKETERITGVVDQAVLENAINKLLK